VGRVLGVTFDPDALAYITAVETADGQQLESGVRVAIDKFVRGCKADGIWTAIKSSCILAGARTLSGALVPLVGTAPTNFNFVAGDYNRKTGLKGDGSTKYLNSNRNNNADPQNNNHNAIYVHTAGTATRPYMGASAATNNVGDNNLGCNISTNTIFARNRHSISTNISGANTTGFMGTSRASSASYTVRVANANTTTSIASQTPFNNNISIFASGGSVNSNARLAFYSIGESLDLALLDARVTALTTAINGAIP
jgi:hypothetical protein